jgi:hypothetical protein
MLRVFEPKMEEVILKHGQQDAALYNTLYYCQRSTCFERFIRSLSGAQIFTCSIRYLSNFFAVTASVDELGLVCGCQTIPNSSTLAVTTNKFDKYLMLHVQI